MTMLLRALGIAIAVAAAIDPGVSVSRSQPIAVELVGGDTDRADRVRQRLLSELGEDGTVASEGEGQAVVIIDRRIDPRSIREEVTISAVEMTSAPNVRLVHAAPVTAVSGQQAVIAVDVDAQTMGGRTSVLTVTQQGVPVGIIEHRWTDARRQRVFVPVVTVGTGTYDVRVSAAPFTGEARLDDNAVDTAIVGVNRPLRVAFIEPRPSWAAGFVRRAVETDPAFEISSVVTTSPGIDVRTGSAPAALTAAALERFDAIVIGAPEELRARDLDALRSFLTVRGGTVVFVPDRRPTGPYAGLIAAAGFDEVLLDTPAALVSAAGERVLRGSELAIPRNATPAMRPLVSLADGRAAIAAWPVGSGSVVFCGALDTWRFRADAEGRFAEFWRATLAAAALAAPPPVRVEVDPPVRRPDIATRIVVRVRPTEFQHGADGSIMLPLVTATATPLSGNDNVSEPVRLWPAAEPGIFEGEVIPSTPGDYRIDVTAGRAQNSALVLRASTPATPNGDDEESTIVAAAAGGAVATADNLSTIVTHLKSIPRRNVRATVHPMRSAWWTLPFALALCGEWALRRRRGLR